MECQHPVAMRVATAPGGASIAAVSFAGMTGKNRKTYLRKHMLDGIDSLLSPELLKAPCGTATAMLR